MPLALAVLRVRFDTGAVATSYLKPLLALSPSRAGIAALWVLSPPVLTVIALHQWRRQRRNAKWPTHVSLVVAITAMWNWLLFLSMLAAGQIGGFGTQYTTARLVGVFIVMSLALFVAAFVGPVGRWKLVLASGLNLALWLGSTVGSFGC